MVYVFLAEGFEEMEALAPIDLLRRVGVEVTTVGVGGKLIKGAHGVGFTADSDGEDLDFSDVDCVVLPGGLPGTTNLDASPMVEACLMKAVEKNALIAAICAAPSVLGHKGLLKGKKATCFPGFEEDLLGALHTGAPVEKDGNIITARGAGVALDFALALVAELKGETAAKELRESLQCA